MKDDTPLNSNGNIDVVDQYWNYAGRVDNIYFFKLKQLENKITLFTVNDTKKKVVLEFTRR